jgi:hypothetical protein
MSVALPSITAVLARIVPLARLGLPLTYTGWSEIAWKIFGFLHTYREGERILEKAGDALSRWKG